MLPVYFSAYTISYDLVTTNFQVKSDSSFLWLPETFITVSLLELEDSLCWPTVQDTVRVEAMHQFKTLQVQKKI